MEDSNFEQADMASPTSQELTFEPPNKRRKISPTSTLPLSNPISDTTSLSQPESTTDSAVSQLPTDKEVKMVDQKTKFAPSPDGSGYKREIAVGVTAFVNASNVGFSGTLKQRYTDFIVNEIVPGQSQAIHLTDDQIPQSLRNALYKNRLTKEEAKAEEAKEQAKLSEKTEDFPEVAEIVPSSEDAADSSSRPEAFELKSEDEKILNKYLGDSKTALVLQMYRKMMLQKNAKPSTFGSVTTDPITDKLERSKFHGEMRRIFNSAFETTAPEGGRVIITAAPAQPKRSRAKPNPRVSQNDALLKGKAGWLALGGEFLHFTLYKENRDTMEVIGILARALGVKPKDFAFAGTKDKRAVTSQRVCVYRQPVKKLAALNEKLWGARIGNFKYQRQRLELGELSGNEFVITLRDCSFGDDPTADTVTQYKLGMEIVGNAVHQLRVNGFINYFGLQRFGTFGIGTDEVGLNILRGDFKEAVDLILAYNEDALACAINPNALKKVENIGRDDISRAHGIWTFRKTGSTKKALDLMPSRFSAESSIIKHLGTRGKERDFLGAVLTIPRNLRTMYVHAYQSLVWNHVASERWNRHGAKVIEGDLIISNIKAASTKEQEVDETGEVIIRPAAHDTAVTHDDIFERARPLTAEEAASGNFTIFDIVLPLPGFDIEYPRNDIGKFYTEFMQSKRGGGIDPEDMRRTQKDFSLSGSYRKMMGQVGKNITFAIKTYNTEDEQLVETDLEKLNKSKKGPNVNSNSPISKGPVSPSKASTPPHKVQTPAKSNIAPVTTHSPTGKADSKSPNKSPTNPTKPTTATISPHGSDGVKTSPNNRRSPTAFDESPELLAWQALPAKLAAEAKAAKEAWEIERQKPKIPSPPAAQPMIKERWVQVDVNENGRYKTGNVVTATHAVTSKADIEMTGVAKLEEVKTIADSTKEEELKAEKSPEAKTAEAKEVEQANTTPGLPKPSRIAVILKFQLPTSHYATIALRELMKAGGVKTYKPVFSAGR